MAVVESRPLDNASAMAGRSAAHSEHGHVTTRLDFMRPPWTCSGCRFFRVYESPRVRRRERVVDC